MIILFYRGCHSQSLECGRINQAGNPRSWPWRVFIYVKDNYPTEGSLISNQWVLTLARNVQNYHPSDILVHLDSIEQLSSQDMALETFLCDPGNELCLLKLASPVTLTDNVRPICLASEQSTFYSGTESWITSFSVAGTEENNLEIVGNNECQCYYGPLSEDTICAGHKERESTCLGNWGGPLMNKQNSVWVQSGVLSSYEGCNETSKAGVYVRVSRYQKWISDTVADTPPVFVTFTSPDIDIDLFFTCSTDPEHPTPTPPCDSVFCGGESLMHFTHFTSLCVLVVSLHVLVGSGGI
ncbi:tryptase-like isoform X3 [Archocentrus centrarchus]|nr:tryptase-like isoform X3 [Archocentrus centrarchus]